MHEECTENEIVEESYVLGALAVEQRVIGEGIRQTLCILRDRFVLNKLTIEFQEFLLNAGACVRGNTEPAEKGCQTTEDAELLGNGEWQVLPFNLALEHKVEELVGEQIGVANYLIELLVVNIPQIAHQYRVGNGRSDMPLVESLAAAGIEPVVE